MVLEGEEAPPGAGAPVNQPEGQQEGQSLTAYLTQERTWRQEDSSQRTKQHNERLSQEKEFIAFQREQADRQVALDLAANIVKCEGHTPTAVREWLKAVDLTIPYSTLTTLIAGLTAQGSLKEEIEHFLDRHARRNAVTWAQIKGHVEKSFLSSEENERLQLEVERMKQLPYQSAASYSREFRRAAETAFPKPIGGANQRTQAEEQIVINHYVKGLSDTKLKEKMFRIGLPKTLADAMDYVTKNDAGNTRVELARERGFLDLPGGHHEPAMEVGAVAAAKSTPLPTAEQQEICNLKRQMAGLTTNFTKMSSVLDSIKSDLAEIKNSNTVTNNPPQQQTYPVRQPVYPEQHFENQFTEDGYPICNHCGHEGHLARHCKIRHRERLQRSQAHQRQAPGRSQPRQHRHPQGGR